MILSIISGMLRTMTFSYNNETYFFHRYPPTENRSLKAWSAADEHLLQLLEGKDITTQQLVIYNDRFGFLSCCLQEFSPYIIYNYKSQEKACRLNLKTNQLEIDEVLCFSPLAPLPGKADLGLMKIPKSLDLFQLQLYQLSQQLTEEATVFASFMTKHFSPQMVSIAASFFEVVEQSKAWKKSRVLIMKKKKPFQERSLLKSISFQNSLVFQQYLGVFSANHIDYASQFFIPHLRVVKNDKRILDLASGNGVLAKMIQLQSEGSEIHLMDDSFLAIESSKLNLSPHNTFFHYSDTLDIFEDNYFDWVVSNPPFHLDHENNIEVAIRLFRGVKRCLREGGRFQLVASRHLNFKTHLIKIFERVETTAENSKFVVYECFL